jgi:hypothetical protein
MQLFAVKFVTTQLRRIVTRPAGGQPTFIGVCLCWLPAHSGKLAPLGPAVDSLRAGGGSVLFRASRHGNPIS